MNRINMNNPNSTPQTLTYHSSMHLSHRQRGALKLRPGPAPTPTAAPAGRVPRIARLMALAIKFQGLIERGEVKDYADLARLGHVTRARVTQIMNLLNLAPDIQEAILFLPLVEGGRDSLKEGRIRPITSQTLWGEQRARWDALAPATLHRPNRASQPTTRVFPSKEGLTGGRT